MLHSGSLAINSNISFSEIVIHSPMYHSNSIIARNENLFFSCGQSPIEFFQVSCTTAETKIFFFDWTRVPIEFLSYLNIEFFPSSMHHVHEVPQTETKIFLFSQGRLPIEIFLSSMQHSSTVARNKNIFFSVGVEYQLSFF